MGYICDSFSKCSAMQCDAVQCGCDGWENDAGQHDYVALARGRHTATIALNGLTDVAQSLRTVRRGRCDHRVSSVFLSNQSTDLKLGNCCRPGRSARTREWRSLPEPKHEGLRPMGICRGWNAKAHTSRNRRVGRACVEEKSGRGHWNITLVEDCREV